MVIRRYQILGSTMSVSDIGSYASGAGFTGNDLITAIAIALAESGGDPGITHKNNNGSTDYGLWQINSIHKSAGFDVSRYADPAYNASWAYKLYQGKRGKFTDWVTYKTGAYKSHLNEASGYSGTQENSSGFAHAAIPISQVFQTAGMSGKNLLIAGAIVTAGISVYYYNRKKLRK